MRLKSLTSALFLALGSVPAFAFITSTASASDSGLAEVAVSKAFSQSTGTPNPYSGVYIGPTLGYGAEDSLVLGATFGARKQFAGRFVLGLDGTLAYNNADTRRSTSISPVIIDGVTITSAEQSAEMEFEGRLQAIAGLTFGRERNTLIYAGIGYAITDLEAVEIQGGGAVSQTLDLDADDNGVFVSLGLEHAFTDLMSLRVEGSISAVDVESRLPDDLIEVDGSVRASLLLRF